MLGETFLLHNSKEFVTAARNYRYAAQHSFPENVAERKYENLRFFRNLKIASGNFFFFFTRFPVGVLNKSFFENENSVLSLSSVSQAKSGTKSGFFFVFFLFFCTFQSKWFFFSQENFLEQRNSNCKIMHATTCLHVLCFIHASHFSLFYLLAYFFFFL